MVDVYVTTKEAEAGDFTVLPIKNITKREPLSSVGEKIVKSVWRTVWGFFFFFKLKRNYDMTEQYHYWVFVQRKLSQYVKDTLFTVTKN